MEITDVSASEASDDDVSLDGSVSDDDGPNNDLKGEDESENESEVDENEEDDESDSSAVSPPPKARKDAKKGTTNSLKDKKYALPSLMGGYLSDSQSEASDIDVAPARKNRRGQKARQAIAEKKFKDQAKHLAKQKQSRDDGWDLKRGAVGGDARTPWKKGIRAPLERGAAGGERESRRPKAPRHADNEGPLHASWEAAKKAKEAQETAVFTGTRVVFD